MECFWCKKPIEGDYLRYDNKLFCERFNDKCIKEYLLDMADGEIEHGYHESDDEWRFHELCRKEDY